SIDNATACGVDDVCNPGTGTCVDCLTDDDCTAPTGVCDVDTHACVECTPDDPSACDNANPVCDATSGACVGCADDADCGTLNPACQSDGSCGQCSAINDSACEQGGTCDVEVGLCIPPCTDD